jgi:ssDNA-binding Zn-finger/Zn-ribbon topoisomerase 1
MKAANGEAREDILTCPKCGGKMMNIYVDENETQRVRCAECRNLVGYTSKLIRVF